MRRQSSFAPRLLQPVSRRKYAVDTSSRVPTDRHGDTWVGHELRSVLSGAQEPVQVLKTLQRLILSANTIQEGLAPNEHTGSCRKPAATGKVRRPTRRSRGPGRKHAFLLVDIDKTAAHDQKVVAALPVACDGMRKALP